jgi:hypothetical protein
MGNLAAMGREVSAGVGNDGKRVVKELQFPPSQGSGRELPRRLYRHARGTKVSEIPLGRIESEYSWVGWGWPHQRYSAFTGVLRGFAEIRAARRSAIGGLAGEFAKNILDFAQKRSAEAQQAKLVTKVRRALKRTPYELEPKRRCENHLLIACRLTHGVIYSRV